MDPDLFTQGADTLPGSMGIVHAESVNFRQLLAEDLGPARLLAPLTPKALRIVAHYRTEPVQLNLVPVTTFFNPVRPHRTIRGGILGVDLLQPEAHHQLHSLVDSVEHAGRTVPVYDLEPVMAVTRAYLERHPFWPGWRIFEANAEFGTPGQERILKAGDVTYACLALGVPAGDGCRLVMEDTGYVKASRTADVIESIATSILACERVENDRRSRLVPEIRYERIYVLATFSNPLEKVKPKHERWLPGLKFYPAWSQVQLLYAEPAVRFLNGRTLDDLRSVTFADWEREKSTSPEADASPPGIPS
jgi:hypothetical protein